MSPLEADHLVAGFSLNFTVIYDSPTVLIQTRRPVVAYRVSGKPIHDAHLVGTMLANGVSTILTINSNDFARYAEIEAINPRTDAFSKPPAL